MLMARFFLLIACIWPVLLVLWFSMTTTTSTINGDSTNNNNNNNNPLSSSNTNGSTRLHAGGNAAATAALKFRDLFDRVDIMGYGPTHPRIAVVIVGDNKDNLLLTVESVFTHTDMNRIFIAVIVANNIADDPAFTQSLQQFDTGSARHWHEGKPDLHVHTPGSKDDEIHGQKVHVMYNHPTTEKQQQQQRGLAECRRDAIDFIHLLEQKHLQAGLKSEAEDLILVLLQSGAQLTVRISPCFVSCTLRHVLVLIRLIKMSFHFFHSSVPC
jgi:hypothetical protein